jgi:hypothetical protein
MKKIKWGFVKYLLIAIIAILAFNIAQNTLQRNIEPIKYVSQEESQIKDSKYIISEAMIMSKLKMKSQIVSYQQDLHKKETHVDKDLLGERRTELVVNGTYKMGLNTKDIEVKHIDSEKGIAYIKLPKPTLLSLDLPYDKIEFDKKQGFFRLAMNEDEEKKFYKSIKNTIKKELSTDKEVLGQVHIFNKEVVRDILISNTNIQSIVFEEN